MAIDWGEMNLAAPRDSAGLLLSGGLRVPLSLRLNGVFFSQFSGFPSAPLKA